jgi:hypothetical protein
MELFRPQDLADRPRPEFLGGPGRTLVVDPDDERLADLIPLASFALESDPELLRVLQCVRLRRGRS